MKYSRFPHQKFSWDKIQESATICSRMEKHIKSLHPTATFKIHSKGITIEQNNSDMQNYLQEIDILAIFIRELSNSDIDIIQYSITRVTTSYDTDYLKISAKRMLY